MGEKGGLPIGFTFIRRARFIVLLFLLVLLAFAPCSGISIRANNRLLEEQTLGVEENSSTRGALPFKPTLPQTFRADRNANGIADTLEDEIAQRALNHTENNYAKVVVALRSTPSTSDASTFTSLDGYVTSQPWENALYGFAGLIPYYRINDFARLNPNVLLIEKEQVSHAQLAYAARQIGARTYVWNNFSLQGDPQSSIAIIDTGIDDSHPDFAPGYGDLNFSRKIVGWNDFTAGATQPYDDNGHGSHVSGLAAGNGFFSTDASGYATATWGANLGSVSPPGGTYLISGMMVNKTGTITIRVKWVTTGTAKLSALPLYLGNSLSTSSWTQVASVTTRSQNTWYTLTYNVTSPPSGYDAYHVTMTLTKGSGNLYVMFTMSWPYTPPADGFSAWTGIAPQTKLVGAKALDYTGSGTTIGLLNAIDWIIANRQTYHIVIASMSLGFDTEVSSVDSAVANLVNSGITTIVSAGNAGAGGNEIYTPGSVDEVITVAATNPFDNIASYSSQGGTSRYTGKTMKPDISAPGGSFLAVPLLSADSNDWDAEKMWSDAVSNDSAPMQGTSMSAPVVSGAASIVIQAMGGYSNWQWTRSQALQPKMILLMAATETYPNLREYDTGYSPTLQRGGKDEHEGYGRLNLDVAVDALLKTYQIGTTVSATLGKPPTITDVSTLGQKLAWARNVHLQTGARYNFTLTVPTGADFDLYLYNSTGTYYGEPAILQKSTTAATGGLEQIIIDNVPYSGTYYLVVKRATAATGPGTFKLESAMTPSHEITALSVEPTPTAVYAIDLVNISVTVKNRGLSTESFNVTVYCNATAIAAQTVLNLLPNNVISLNFTWNTMGVAPSHYVIKAQADVVPNEYNVTDNTVTYSGTVQVKILGDINGDANVDGVDFGLFAPNYGRTGLPLYFSSDFDSDGDVDGVDFGIFASNYGRHYP